MVAEGMTTPDRAGTRPRIGAVNSESGSSAAGSALGEVRSADGTTIGYQRVGAGPAVVLLHGAGQSSANLMRLARALSGAFMVYVPDRRGRSRSGPYGEFHGLSTEIEDLSALLDACAASRVFGLSAGAVIAIEAALVRPDITKLALYEPPLTFDSVVHGDWAPQYQRQLTAGKPGAALVTVLKATADRTSVIRWIPRHPLGAALDFAIKRTADRPAPDGVMSPRELIPTLPYDAQTVNGAARRLQECPQPRRLTRRAQPGPARRETSSAAGHRAHRPGQQPKTRSGSRRTAPLLLRLGQADPPPRHSSPAGSSW